MYENDETLAVQPVKNNNELDELYRELGKAYYEGRFEDPLPELLPYFDKITAVKNKKEKQPKVCPQCGTPLKEGAVFCGECGYKIK